MNEFLKATLIYLTSIASLICAIALLVVIIVRLVRMKKHKSTENRKSNRRRILIPLCWFIGFVVLYIVCVIAYSSIPLDM